MRRLLIAVALVVLVLVVTRTLAWDEARGSVAAPDPRRDQAVGEARAFDLREVDAAVDAEPTVELEPASASARTAAEVDDKPTPAVRSALSATLDVRLSYAEAPEPNSMARVSVSRESGRTPIPRLQQANRDGRASFEVEPGIALRIKIYTQPAGRPPIERRVEPFAPGERRTLEIEIPALTPTTFFGRVLDAERRPIEGAEVRLGFTEDLLWTDSQVRETKPSVRDRAGLSDAQGFFELRAESLPFRALRIDAPGFAWTLEAFDEIHPTRELAREVILERAASLAVVVGPVDASVTVGIDGQRFEPTHLLRSDVRLPDVRWMAIPGIDGVARFAGLTPGCELDLRVSGIDPTRLLDHPAVRLQPGEARMIDLRAGTAATLAGSLRDSEGNPHVHTEVWLLPRDRDLSLPFSELEEARARVTETDGTGRFRYDDVTDGNWWVGASPASGCIATRWPVSVVGGVADRALDLVAERGLYIEGRAVSWRSNPVPSGIAGAYNGETRSSQTTWIDSSGAFRIGPLVAGRYDVRVSPGDEGPDVCGRSEPLEVEAGARDVVVVCPPAGRLRIVLDDSFDATAERLQYHISRALPNGIRQVVNRSFFDVVGEIETNGLSPGSYDVYVWTSERRFASARGLRIEPKGGVQEVRLELSQGGSVRVLLGGSESRFPLTVLHGDVLVDRGAWSGPATLDFVVPPGRVDVELRIPVDGEYLSLQRTAVVPAAGDPVLVDFGDGR